MNKIKRGLVVWVKLVGNGSEQNGLRPCIVVQNDKGNMFSNTTIVVPLTKKTNKSKLLPTHTIIKGEILGSNFSDSIALAEQVRVVDMLSIVQTGKLIPKQIIDSISQTMMISLGINTA